MAKIFDANTKDGVTRAQLKAQMGPFDDACVFCTGDTAPGDGTSGLYVWDEDSTDTADAVSCIAPIDPETGVAAVTGRWKAIANLIAVSAIIADVSTPSNAYVASPVNGKVRKVLGCLQGAITVKDSVVTTAINGVAITNGGFTVGYNGSAAGDVDVATPTANNRVAIGDTLRATTDGESTTSAAEVVTFLIEAAL